MKQVPIVSPIPITLDAAMGGERGAQD